MKRFIDAWAGILDESKQFRKEYLDFVNEDEEDDIPSYADVLALNKENPSRDEDIMTKDEYEALSDEEKDEIHQASKYNLKDVDVDIQYLRSISNKDVSKDDDYLDKKNVWVSRKVNIMKSDNGKDLTTVADESDTKHYSTREEAIEVLKEMIRNDSQKYGIEPSQMKQSVPQAILKTDPNAIGFMVDEVEGYGEKKIMKLRGKEAKDPTKTPDFYFTGGYKSIKRLTYVLYSSDHEIDTKSYEKLYKEISKKGDDDFSDIDESEAGNEKIGIELRKLADEAPKGSGLQTALLDVLEKFFSLDEGCGKKASLKEDLGEQPDTGWFDEDGNMIKDIPEECVEDCTVPGRDATESCEEWVEKLNFKECFPTDMARRYLAATGGWERDDLESMSLDDIAVKLLWVICGELKDGNDQIYIGQF